MKNEEMKNKVNDDQLDSSISVLEGEVKKLKKSCAISRLAMVLSSEIAFTTIILNYDHLKVLQFVKNNAAFSLILLIITVFISRRLLKIRSDKEEELESLKREKKLKMYG